MELKFWNFFSFFQQKFVCIQAGVYVTTPTSVDFFIFFSFRSIFTITHFIPPSATRMDTNGYLASQFTMQVGSNSGKLLLGHKKFSSFTFDVQLNVLKTADCNLESMTKVNAIRNYLRRISPSNGCSHGSSWNNC